MSEDIEDIKEENNGGEALEQQNVAEGTASSGDHDAGGSAESGSVTATPSEYVPSEPEQTGHWYDGLKDVALRSNPNITKHDSVDGLAKAYVEATRKLGQKGIMPLPADATPEQRAAYNAIRRGESIKTPSDYSWGKGKETGSEYSRAMEALFNAGADDYMASSVMDSLARAAVEDELAEEQAAERIYAQETEKLRSEWGENYLVNLKANDILLSRYPEAMRILKSLGCDKMASVQLMLHSLSAAASDGQIHFENARERSLDERIDDITNSDAFKQSWHPDHKKAQQARAALIMELSQRK